MTTYYSWEHITTTRGRKKEADASDLIKRVQAAKKFVGTRKVETEARPIVDGARVVLSNDSPYNDAPDNPKEGGYNACVGTVLYAGGDIEVEWDNGIINHYRTGDLIAVDDYHKTWMQDKRTRDGKTHGKEEYTGKFKVGTPVYLVPGFYSPQQSNPCLGSVHQCIGKVSRANLRDKNKHRISVQWANGAKNSYVFMDAPGRACLVEIDDVETLRQLLKSNPNLAFKAQFNHTGGLAGAVADHLNVTLEEG